MSSTNDESVPSAQESEQGRNSSNDVSLQLLSGYNTEADYIVICKDKTGHHRVRFEVHKQAMEHSSLFFREMFAACTPKSPDKIVESQSKSNEHREVELMEGYEVIKTLLFSIYGLTTPQNFHLERIRLQGVDAFSK